MFNFFSSYYFRLFFCFLAPILSFNSRIEAKTRHHSNFESNVDVDAIRNCHSLDDKIDCFINIGMQYQQSTSKKFKYKKFLRQTYKYLERHDVHVDKKTKKDLRKLIQNRISERYFGHSRKRYIADSITYHFAAASSHNAKGEYSNGFREGIVEVAIGGVCIV